MPVCSSCEEKQPRDAFSGKQLKQSAGARKCLACVKLALHDVLVDRLHNCSPNMRLAFDELANEAKQALEATVEERLTEWQERVEDLERQAEFGGDEGDEYATRCPLEERFHVLGWSRSGDPEDEVVLVHNVLTPEQCDAILAATSLRAAARGGWDSKRHPHHPTTDMRCAEACADAPAVEQMVRAAVFKRICEPLASRWAGERFLAEHLTFRDLFFVRYSANEGEQRGLSMHRDGSAFSFNVLLSDPSDFDGGGISFSIKGWPKGHGKTVTIPRGAALVHSGSLLHGGRDITRGTREILVGFMDMPKERTEPPSAGELQKACAAAARETFHKFGSGAWSRAELLPDGSALPLSA